MITYVAYPGREPAEADELRGLLAHAAAEDAEAGFPTLHVEPAPAQLVVRLRQDRALRRGRHADGPVAGYLRIERQEDGYGLLGLVVRPEFRSLGVATMLFEQLGFGERSRAARGLGQLGGADLGLADLGLVGLRAWARGNHPAAQRLARRFGVPRIAARWRLQAPLRSGGGPADTRLLTPVRPAEGARDEAAVAAVRAAVAVPGAALDAPDSEPRGIPLLARDGSSGDPKGLVWADPDAGEPTEYGTAGRISAPLVLDGRCGHATRTSLLTAACVLLGERGVRGGAITVDAADAPLVRDCRLLGFRHDRTDSLYQV